MATLQFKGKSAVWNHHLSVPYHTLEKDAKKSLKGADAEENLIIEGDNLLALKSLLPKYQGQVKCIYIDPPYNTGNEGWAYNDNVNSPTIREWIGKVVGKDDLTRHDKWLSMMTPRLKLLRELLTDDGAIFISIDDNEEYRLHALMNEVFGESNFISQIIWKANPRGRAMDRFLATTKEYILCYAKNSENIKLSMNKLGNDELLDEYRFTDEISKYKKGYPLHNGTRAFHINNRPNLAYSIYYNPKTRVAITKDEKKKDKNGAWYLDEAHSDNTLTKKGLIRIIPSLNRQTNQRRVWRWGADKFSREYKTELIFIQENGGLYVYQKDRLEESGEKLEKHKDMIDGIRTDEGGHELQELFGSKIFDFPKPTRLIKHILSFFDDKDVFILDAFAGSGTTAQAVLEYNEEMEANRKFILVQLHEEIQKNTPAYEAGFRKVHEVTRERVKRVIAKNKYKTGFSYYTLGSSIDAESILTGKLPTYKEFAKYVYYLATGKNHPDEKKIKEEDSFVGKTDHQSVYLIYEKNADALKKLAITLDWAQKTHKKGSNKKIVYAPACYLDDEALEQFNIKFVSIPYNLFERTT